MSIQTYIQSISARLTKINTSSIQLLSLSYLNFPSINSQSSSVLVDQSSSLNTFLLTAFFLVTFTGFAVSLCMIGFKLALATLTKAISNKKFMNPIVNITMKAVVKNHSLMKYLIPFRAVFTFRVAWVRVTAQALRVISRDLRWKRGLSKWSATQIASYFEVVKSISHPLKGTKPKRLETRLDSKLPLRKLVILCTTIVFSFQSQELNTAVRYMFPEANIPFPAFDS
ncbi:hypothetical protein FGO68_gene10325 [Halteria grandinella]|uniref:Transmembrane protein n=1 Tax=Halteria grandinella TaxID=5974 RepID=A0A8J8NRP3_HALGN|nr:hypothetical protein FGO68_gene10325 [Halteria grandinella]